MKKISKNRHKTLAKRKIQLSIKTRFKSNDEKITKKSFILSLAQFKKPALVAMLLLLSITTYNLIKPRSFSVYCYHNQISKINWPPQADWTYNYPVTGKSINSHKITEIKKLDDDIRAIIKGTPMETMTVAMAQKDRPVAAYLVGIAMKESKFGKFSPKKNGHECFNYWGYRGKENTTASGYSCFNSPEHAIAVVGGKISEMLSHGSKTPAQMISWKCGSTCAGHDPVSVKKWIDDVSINYYKLSAAREVAKYNR
ncbi:MAG: hypothetical protein WCG01_01900 [bacterium]